MTGDQRIPRSLSNNFDEDGGHGGLVSASFGTGQHRLLGDRWPVELPLLYEISAGSPPGVYTPANLEFCREEATVPVAQQLVVMLENRPGALAELCSELAKVAVNIQAIQASEARPFVSVRLLVSQRDVAKQVLDRLGLKYKEESILTVLVSDRPGALGRITRKLADAGINIEYLYGTIDKGTKRALILCGVSDFEAGARIIR